LWHVATCSHEKERTRFSITTPTNFIPLQKQIKIKTRKRSFMQHPYQTNIFISVGYSSKSDNEERGLVGGKDPARTYTRILLIGIWTGETIDASVGIQKVFSSDSTAKRTDLDNVSNYTHYNETDTDSLRNPNKFFLVRCLNMSS
jgi:hypothetical protein